MDEPKLTGGNNMATLKDLELAERKLQAAKTPEKNIGPGGVPKRPNIIETPPNHIVITVEAYERIIGIIERYKLIENYVKNHEFCSGEVLRAMVGYTGEE